LSFSKRCFSVGLSLGRRGCSTHSKDAPSLSPPRTRTLTMERAYHAMVCVCGVVGSTIGVYMGHIEAVDSVDRRDSIWVLFGTHIVYTSFGSACGAVIGIGVGFASPIWIPGVILSLPLLVMDRGNKRSKYDPVDPDCSPPRKTVPGSDPF